MTAPTRNGTFTIEGTHTVMTFRRRLPYPIADVWAAITDPAQREEWFGKTTIDAREGGTIGTVATEPPAAEAAKRVTGRILTWDPPHVFEHEWHSRIVEDSVVRYELTEDGDNATILVFTHRGLSVSNTMGFIPGTHAFLDRLEAQLAGEPLPSWQERYNEVAPSYA